MQDMISHPILTDILAIRHYRVSVRETDERRGRFETIFRGRINFARIPHAASVSSSLPAHLLSEGANPDAIVEMRHASRPDTVAAFGKVGALAKIDFREDQTSGPRFCKWRPPPQGRA
ncbi:hypothetical protein ACVWWG_007973 [Bradyrhizobium sp. LB7.2]